MLTLNVRGPSYLGLTRSISCLLMPWLLTSPGHQQPWYWLHRICRSFSHLRTCFMYLCQIHVEEWHKMQIYIYVPYINIKGRPKSIARSTSVRCMELHDRKWCVEASNLKISVLPLVTRGVTIDTTRLLRVNKTAASTCYCDDRKSWSRERM